MANTARKGLTGGLFRVRLIKRKKVPEVEVRKLSAQDEPALEQLMGPHRGYSIFLLGNVLHLGWENPALEYWGAWEAGNMTAVLMRYKGNWTAWWNTPGEFLPEFTRILSRCTQATITGRPDILEALKFPRLTVQKRYEQRLAVLEQLIPPAPACAVRWARENEAEEIVELYRGDEVPRTRESILARITGGGQAVGFAVGKMVTAAAVTARTRDSAMLGGVWTLPEHRNKGYASWCTAWLCRQLVDLSLTPALFYHNPAAGSIYLRLGFREIGPYAMAVWG